MSDTDWAKQGCMDQCSVVSEGLARRTAEVSFAPARQAACPCRNGSLGIDSDTINCFLSLIE